MRVRSVAVMALKHAQRRDLVPATRPNWRRYPPALGDHPRPKGRVDAGLDHAYAVTSYAVQGATFSSGLPTPREQRSA